VPVTMEYPFQLTGNEKLKPYSVFWYSIDFGGCGVGKGAHPTIDPANNKSKANDENLKYF
jgi:hypothetical protein